MIFTYVCIYIHYHDRLKQFQNLLVFLRHPIVRDVDRFVQLIRKPLSEMHRETSTVGSSSSRYETAVQLLRRVVKGCLLRHDKATAKLQPPIFKVRTCISVYDLYKVFYIKQCFFLKCFLVIPANIYMSHDMLVFR